MLASGVFGIATTLATSYAFRPSDVVVDRLEYRASFDLKPDSHTRVWGATVPGARCFWKLGESPGILFGGSPRHHFFRFEEPGDKLIVQVDDRNGVEPGRSYHYALYQKDAEGNLIQAFSFFTAAPTDAPGPVHRFAFEISANARDPDLRIKAGEAVAGTYELARPNRDASVTLDVLVAKSMTVHLCDSDDAPPTL